MEEAARRRPTSGVVGRGAAPTWAAGDDEAPCELAVSCPFEEVPGAGSTGRPFGQPVVDVALGAAAQVALGGRPRRPGRRRRCSRQTLAWRVGVRAAPAASARWRARRRTRQRRIRAQQPALALVGDAGEMVSSPGLEAHEGVIAPGQHAVGDEQVAQVVGALAGAVGVQRLVGEGELAGGDFAQEAGRRRAAQPVVGAVRLGCCHDRLVDGPERPVDLPDELGRTAGERAPYATAVEVEPFFGTTRPAGGQWGDAGAVGAPASARAGGRHQTALGPTALTGPPPGQGGPVARLAHRPLGPTRRRRGARPRSGHRGWSGAGSTSCRRAGRQPRSCTGAPARTPRKWPAGRGNSCRTVHLGRRGHGGRPSAPVHSASRAAWAGARRAAHKASPTGRDQPPV